MAFEAETNTIKCCEVYTDSLRLAASLERCLDKPLLHTFFAVTDANTNNGGFYYFASLRSRSVYNQLKHAVVRCCRSANGTHSLGLQQGGKQWDYISLWTLAKLVLQAQYRRVFVFKMAWVSNDDGSVRFVSPPLDRWADGRCGRPFSAPEGSPRGRAGVGGEQTQGPPTQAWEGEADWPLEYRSRVFQGGRC